MKEMFHKILAIFLTSIVLFSTTSFTIEKHICGDNICAVSLESFNTYNPHQDNDSCCNDVGDSCCKGRSGCCSDETQFIKGSIVKKEAVTKLKFNQVDFLISFILTKQKSLNSNISAFKYYMHYTPPIIVKDILVNYQIFLI